MIPSAVSFSSGIQRTAPVRFGQSPSTQQYKDAYMALVSYVGDYNSHYQKPSGKIMAAIEQGVLKPDMTLEELEQLGDARDKRYQKIPGTGLEIAQILASHYKFSILDLALVRGDETMMQALMDKGGKIQKKGYIHNLIAMIDHHRQFAEYRKPHEEKLKIAIQADPSLLNYRFSPYDLHPGNRSDVLYNTVEQGYDLTPLEFAIRIRSKEAVSSLLGLGADKRTGKQFLARELERIQQTENTEKRGEISKLEQQREALEIQIRALNNQIAEIQGRPAKRQYEVDELREILKVIS